MIGRFLFLDFDGVLNSDPFLASLRARGVQCGSFADIQSEKVDLLNCILERTGARVVLSTSWRRVFTLGVIRESLGLSGFRGEIVGCTPARMSSAHCRSYEVGWYLEDHDINPSQIVILEDAYNMGVLSSRTVYTDPETGLTDADVEKAVRLFE